MKYLCPLDGQKMKLSVPLLSCVFFWDYCEAQSLLFSTGTRALNKTTKQRQNVLQRSTDLNLLEPQQYRTGRLPSDSSKPTRTL